jgi:hypothetical protein
MTDVPEIPLDQIQQRVVAMWMGSFYGSSGYVARKLERKGCASSRTWERDRWQPHSRR